MRINDIILESSNQEEGIASALGTGVGALSKGIGAVAGGARGAIDKFAQGYKAGRGAVNGQGSSNGTAPGANNQGTGSNSQNTGNMPNTQQAGGSTNNASPFTNSQKPIDIRQLQTSIQRLQGADIEKFRGMLKAKAGIKEGQELDELNLGAVAAGAKRMAGQAGNAIKTAYNKAAPVVKKAAQATGNAIKAAPAAIGKAGGAVGNAVTTAKGAYQQARGATMTPQDIQHAIAIMTPQDAKNLLDYFNSIHPEAAPATTAPAPTNTANTDPNAHPADDNPNINLGYNEGVGYSRFLGMQL
jgi:hypothetical protein